MLFHNNNAIFMIFKIIPLEYPLFFPHPHHSINKDIKHLEPLNLAARQDRIQELRRHFERPQGIEEDRKIFYERTIRSLLETILNKESKKQNLLENLFEKEPFLRRSIEELQITSSNPHQIKEVILKTWFRKNDLPTSRVLFLSIDPKQPPGTVSAYFFGNVDLFIAPPESNVDTIEWKSEEQSGDLPKEIFPKIARYLDNGQSLNLSRLREIGVSSLGDFSSDPYQQHFQDFTYYSSIAPNGCLLQNSLNHPFRVTHQTPHKDKILESKKLNVSKSGCMGNVTYTTELVGDQGNLLGGHAIGLHRRKYGDLSPKKEQLLCMEVQRTGNFITNWIEKLGRGQMFLLARDRWLFSESSHAASISLLDKKISQNVLDQYRTIYPLLVFCKLYAKNLKKDVLTEKDPKIFQATRTILSHIGSSKSSIANGIFFEIIKDYTLLFQSDTRSETSKAMRSFNMTTHYEIVFELRDEMRLNWDTASFPIAFEKTLEILRRRRFLNTEEDERLFARFFLDRLAHYVNVGCLGGHFILPHPDEVSSFLNLSQVLPNLAGLIYNNLVKKTTSSAIEAFKEYSQHLQAVCDQSYDDRRINVTVKCGFSRTEEIGIRSSASVIFPDFELLETGELHYEIKPSLNNLDLSIQGTSNTDGFTKRY